MASGTLSATTTAQKCGTDVPWPPDQIVRMILLPPRLTGRQQMKLAARAFLVDNSLS